MYFQKLALTAILFSLMACGTDPAQEAKPEETTQGGGVERQPDDPKENIVEYRKDGEQIALALEGTEDLPVCERANERQLAWIKNTEQFFACTDGTWVEVPVKGKSGEAGPQGPSGPKGDPGDPAVANQWFDPMTENTWLVGAAITQTPIILGQVICSGGYRMPTSAEVQTAVLHGLSLASGSFGGSTSFWTSDTITVGVDQIPVYVNNSGQANVSTGNTAGVACLAVEE